MARRLDEGYQEFLSWVTTERWREEGVYRTSSDFNKNKIKSQQRNTERMRMIER